MRGLLPRAVLFVFVLLVLELLLLLLLRPPELGVAHVLVVLLDVALCCCFFQWGALIGTGCRGGGQR